MVWEHPYQVQVSSLDEVAKNLNLLTTSSGNWAYAFVWFNEDAQHVPLPKEGHLSAMINGVPSRNTCGCLHQLGVHQVLWWEYQVVYPEGLNRGLELVVTSQPESLAHGMSMLNEPAFLLVDLPKAMSGDQVHKVSAPYRSSTPTSPTHLTMEHPPKADSHISMTAEVQELLSHAVLGHLQPGIREFHLKKANICGLGGSTLC